MKDRKISMRAGLFAVGWFVFVVAGVRFGSGAFELWRTQQEALSQAQERLRRFQGWAAVEDPISSRRQEVLGSLARVAPSDLTWAVLQGVQEAAREKNLVIIELRPAQLPDENRRQQILRLDLKMEGPLEQFTGFFKQLPDRVAGVRLEQLQLAPLPEPDRIQAIVRLQLARAEEGR